MNSNKSLWTRFLDFLFGSGIILADCDNCRREFPVGELQRRGKRYLCSRCRDQTTA